MEISGKTIVCGLIGDPVEHSMSPAMQNAAFHELGLDCVYVPFRVKSHDLSRAIEAMRGLNIRGFNVTIPHKVLVMGLLDKLDDLAGKIGAVNTIANDGGVLTGYNTDADGFIRPLLDKGIDPKDKQVLVIGAGGAARAICLALADKGADLIILNRTLERAGELADRLSQHSLRPARIGQLNAHNLKEATKVADIIVNTTSLGMGSSNETPVPQNLLRSGAIVCDIVYSPVKTRLLKEAEAVGCVTVRGIEMLAWQGALAFERWTGQTAPIALMKEELVRHIEHEN